MIDHPDNKCTRCGIECGSSIFMTWELTDLGVTYKCNGRSKRSKYHKDACKLRVEIAKKKSDGKEQEA